MTNSADDGYLSSTLHILEQNPIAVQGLRNILEIVGQCIFYSSVPQLPGSDDQLLFLVDLGTLVQPRQHILRLLRVEYPRASILVMDIGFSEDQLLELFSFGVVAFITYERAPRELPLAVRSVADGTAWVDARMLELFRRQTSFADGRGNERLTTREQTVLDLLQRNLCNKEIASKLGISVSTVKFHLINLFAKLGVHDRFGAREYGESQQVMKESRGVSSEARLAVVRPEESGRIWNDSNGRRQSR